MKTAERHFKRNEERERIENEGAEEEGEKERAKVKERKRILLINLLA